MIKLADVRSILMLMDQEIRMGINVNHRLLKVIMIIGDLKNDYIHCNYD